MRKRLFAPFRSQNPFVRVTAFLVVGFGIAIPATFLMLVAFIALVFSPSFSEGRCGSVLEIERTAHIKLPLNSIHIESDCGRLFLLEGFWIKTYFDMRPSDLEAFVNSTNVALPLSTTGKPKKLYCSSCNELPDLIPYLYGTYSADEWFEEIFIDTSNPSLYRVYFTLLAG